MNYYLIALLTTSGSALVIYFFLNKLLRIHVRVIPLMLCAVCSLFLSMALPKIILRFSNWLGTVAVLTLFAIIFAYFMAFYENEKSSSQANADTDNKYNKDVHDNIAADAIAASIAISSEEASASRDIHLQVTNTAEYICSDDKTSTNCISEIETASDDANLLMDYAFQLKELKEHFRAAKTLQKVLQLNQTSDAAPLLVYEIASAYIQAKAYNEAAECLLHSLSISSIADNMAAKSQINIMIAELEKLQKAKV